MEKQRLDGYVAKAFGLSRSEARGRILRSGVLVNGAVCKQIDLRVSPLDSVTFEGENAIYKKYVYIMMNKPKDVICAVEDKLNTTVTELLPQYKSRKVSPIGRLDKDTTGLLLLSDDGDFHHRVTSPKKHIEKEYLVTLDTDISADMCIGFEKGVILQDGTKLMAAALKATENSKVCIAVIKQGVYHQIKRSFGVYGAGVNELKRLRIGGLHLDEALAEGEFRELTQAEIDKIFE